MKPFILTLLLLIILISATAPTAPTAEPEPTPLIPVDLNYYHRTGLFAIWWPNVRGQAYWVEASTDGGRTWRPAIAPWPIVSRARTLHVWHKIDAQPNVKAAIFRVRTTFD